MVFLVIIRGPLGVGKSSVAEQLADRLGAGYISIDRILEERGLEEWEAGYVSLKSFLRANEFAAASAERLLSKGTPVIFDGNFYYEHQIEDLIDRLHYRQYIFTLEASVGVCIERDQRRFQPMGENAVREVFSKSTSFDSGIGIDATGSIDGVVAEIISRLP